MEPFIVYCAACQSRIRVRNDKLIGQRVSCPKCKADVLVTTPAPPKIHVEANRGPRVDSAALTKDGLTGTLGIYANDSSTLPDANSPTAENPFSNFDFSEVDNVLSQQVENPAASDSAAMANWNVEERAPQRAAPTQQWSSHTTARSRQYLVVAFLGLSGCILAGLLFAFFLKWYGKDTLQTASGVEKLNVADANQNKSNNVGDSAEVNGGSNLSSTNDSESISTETSTPVQQTRIEIEPAPEPANTVDSADSIKASPPETTQVVGSNLEPDAATNDTVAADIPPHIKELVKIIGEPEAISLPPKLLVPDKPAVTDMEINTGISSVTMTPAAKLLETANERQLRSLSFQQKRLPEALSIWNNVVGLPTVINPRNLAAADFDLESQFDLEIKGSSAVEAVEKLASNLGLKAESQENRFWVLQAPIADETKLPWSIKIDDLVKSPEELTWLKETIELFFPGMSSGLSYEGGNLTGKLEVIDRLTWFSIVRLLENWRMQRSIPVQLSSYRPESLRVPFVMATSITELQKPLTEVSASQRTLASFLNHHVTAAGLSCWVDWPALEYLPVRLVSPQRAISPQTLRVSVTKNRSLASVLNELEFELGIVTLLIDQKTLWLTSHFAYRRVPEIFVIPSEGKPLDSYWSQYLRPLTPIDSSGISQVLLRETPDGQFIIAKCCWPTLQFE